MKKLVLLLAVPVLSILSSCNKDDEPRMVKDDDLVGYWKLERVREDGDEVDFDDFVDNLEDFYYYFDEDGNFHSVVDYGISNLIGFSGTWELNDSELQLEFESGDDYEIKVLAYSANGLTFEDDDYELVFERVDEEDFLWSQFSAEVEGNDYIAILTEGYSEAEEVVVYGESGGNYTMAVFVDPTEVDEGDDVSLTNGEIAIVGYYSESNDEYYFSTSGELHIDILDSELFAGTFDDVDAMDELEGSETSFTNGRFKVTLRN